MEKDGSLNSVSPAPVVTWEIPVLARYDFGGKHMQPFLEAGPSVPAGSATGTATHQGTAQLWWAGVQLRAGWLNIAPQVRYTRWAADPQAELSRTGRNQAEILLGLYYAHQNPGPRGVPRAYLDRRDGGDESG